MSFSTDVIKKFSSAMKQSAGALMTPQRVTPYQAAVDVQVRLAVTTRRAGETDLTGGAIQDTNMVAKIDADDWDAKVGREPGKGDVIYWADKRYAIDRASLSAPGGVRVFYTARLMG